MPIDPVTGAGAAVLFTLCGLLVRVLMRTDDRWVRIVDSKDEDLDDMRSELQALRNEVGHLRDDNERCNRKTAALEGELSVVRRQLAEALELPQRGEWRTRSDDDQ